MERIADIAHRLSLSPLCFVPKRRKEHSVQIKSFLIKAERRGVRLDPVVKYLMENWALLRIFYMSQLPGWLPPLLSLLNQGCAESPMFTVADDEKVFHTGKEVCLTLWPFILELPEYVAAVRKKTPPHMDAAVKLFNQLADEERVYQQLYLKQCELAGITDEQLKNVVSSNGATMLTQAMRRYCFSDSYVDGVLAIITAELGATAWARSAQPVFESFFTRHAQDFAPEAVEQGLSWLRLHAKPNLKHALWLRKMLGDLAQFQGPEMPAPVLEVLQAVYAVLQVEKQIPAAPVEQLTVSIG